MTSPLRVAIVGAGRVGCSLFRALQDAGAPPVLLWTRSLRTRDQVRTEGLPATEVLPAAIDADLALLAVEDSAIASLSQVVATRLRSDAVVAHTAGAQDLTPLAGSHSKGSFHPIVSVATRRTPLAGTYAGIAASDATAEARLSALASLLKMGVVRPTGERAGYHAAAAIVGNFPQALLEAATRVLQGSGLTAEEARLAFGPLLVSAAHNAAQLGPAAGLTGPVLRGDVATVERHLKSLADDRVAALYRAASLLAVDLAERRGAPSTDALRKLLSED